MDLAEAEVDDDGAVRDELYQKKQVRPKAAFERCVPRLARAEDGTIARTFTRR
jgi:hypothetical protein